MKFLVFIAKLSLLVSFIFALVACTDSSRESSDPVIVPSGGDNSGSADDGSQTVRDDNGSILVFESPYTGELATPDHSNKIVADIPLEPLANGLIYDRPFSIDKKPVNVKLNKDFKWDDSLLKLIDNKVVDKNTLYGSWAGAFGNFQFMPSTIKNYAIDYNKNFNIELKKIDDSFASAANYIKKIGWKKNEPCFYKVELKEEIPTKYLNSSARKIINKRKVKFFKKYLKSYEQYNLNDDAISAIITPDKDIIPGAKNLKPAFIVFSNYEKILKWNRSLRFALAVCTLKDKFKNEI